MTLELFLVIVVVFLFSFDSDTWTDKFITMSILVTIIVVAASYML